MNCSLNGTSNPYLLHVVTLTTFLGLIGHLKSHFLQLHQLFLYMKLWTKHPLTPEEIQFASGQKPFDSSIHAEYLQKLDA